VVLANQLLAAEFMGWSSTLFYASCQRKAMDSSIIYRKYKSNTENQRPSCHSTQWSHLF